MPVILEIKNLIKHFDQVKAVNDISLSIEQGICLGFLGPNGAGKTTTIEMIEGITTPDSGEILYKGRSIDQNFKHEAGIMFQHTALQEFISVRETLQLFSQFYASTLPIEEIIASCNLAEFLDQSTHKLSGGQRQRVLLAIALINDPDILFLDEPTTGLDPQARHNFWELISRIKQRGKTIILTTHYMDEAYALSDDIAIIDRGQLIERGTPDTLLKKYFDEVIMQLPTDAFSQPLQEIPLPETDSLWVTGEQIEITTHQVEQTIKRLLEHKVSLNNLRIRDRTLEDLFLELTGKALRQ